MTTTDATYSLSPLAEQAERDHGWAQNDVRFDDVLRRVRNRVGFFPPPGRV